MISDALWRRRYAADLRLVGRSITINGNSHLCRRYRAAVVAGADRYAPPRTAAVRAPHRHLEADRTHAGRARRRELGSRCARARAVGGERRAGPSTARGVVARTDPGTRSRRDNKAGGRAGACARNLRCKIRLACDPRSIGALLLTACVSSRTCCWRGPPPGDQFATRSRSARTPGSSASRSWRPVLTAASGVVAIGWRISGFKRSRRSSAAGCCSSTAPRWRRRCSSLRSRSASSPRSRVVQFRPGRHTVALPRRSSTTAGERRSAAAARSVAADAGRRRNGAGDGTARVGRVAAAQFRQGDQCRSRVAIDGLLTADLSPSGAATPRSARRYRELIERVRGLPQVRRREQSAISRRSPPGPARPARSFIRPIATFRPW